MNKPDLPVHTIIWLATGIILAGLPHWQRLPVWIPSIHLVLIIARIYFPYKYSAIWSTQTSIINILRLLIMVFGVLGIYSSYGTLAGRDVGIALLVLLGGLKIFESKNKRDFYICTYLGYFLVITNFFYTQTIPTAVYMFFVIIVMTSNLIEFNDTENKLSILNRFRIATTFLLQSLPIMLVLFILFPRVNGPLWGLPKDAYTGITGIDDQMSPGTISKLVQSSEVAFRVTFEGKIPDQSRLYWRGPVLWQTDGRKWTTGASNNDHENASATFSGDQIKYDLIIEPTNKKWLFGLELVSDIPEQTHLTYDYQLKTLEPIRTRKAFSLTSYTDFNLNNTSSHDLERGLQLPEYSHLRSQEFGATLRTQYKEPEKIIQATLDWFKDQAFEYTLKPPLITGDPVDEFLFNSRKGFCEHFAAAFTVIMRSAGIPARIVTGYQGGEVNPVGNYLIVRQYDAHAWTEVWLEDKGWVRIDPTFAISPARVNDGIETAMPDAVFDIPLGLKNNLTIYKLWQQLRNTVDMVNYQWAQWILGYGPERQARLLKKIGFKSINWKELTILLFIILGIIVAAIALYIFKNTPNKIDPAKKYYDVFCKKLAKLGIPRYSYEGPDDFAQRVARIRQDIEKEVSMITKLYISVRYCSNDYKLKELQTLITSFQPNNSVSVSK